MQAPQPWPYPSLIAHRGGGTLAPENTLAAMQLAKKMGYQMVEFDVKLSQDSVPILLHDTMLERTTNGSGKASDYSYPDIAKLDAGSWHSPTFANERIPTLETIGNYLIKQNIACNIEIKPTPGQEALTGEVVAARASEIWRNANARPIFSSFSYDALLAASRIAPHIARGFLSAQLPENWQHILSTLNCLSIHLSCQNVTAEMVRTIHQAGWRVGVWTVNDPSFAKRLLSWGVDAVFTDIIDLISPHSTEFSAEVYRV